MRRRTSGHIHTHRTAVGVALAAAAAAATAQGTASAPSPHAQRTQQVEYFTGSTAHPRHTTVPASKPLALRQGRDRRRR